MSLTHLPYTCTGPWSPHFCNYLLPSSSNIYQRLPCHSKLVSLSHQNEPGMPQQFKLQGHVNNSTKRYEGRQWFGPRYLCKIVTKQFCFLFLHVLRHNFLIAEIMHLKLLYWLVFFTHVLDWMVQVGQFNFL